MKLNYFKLLLICLILNNFTNLFSNENQLKVESKLKNDSKLRIIISKGSGHPAYLSYYDWVHKYYPDVEIIDVYSKNKKFIDSVLVLADGLLLSGGVDVHPGRFGKSDKADQCEIDLGRDTLEFHLIETSLNKKLPILGICRGLQMINVATGGSLIVDIPTEVENHLEHQNGKPEDSYHKVIIKDNTLLYNLLKSNQEIVNSNHHQAIDKVGNNIKVSSTSPDGIVESIEWAEPSEKSWLLAIQWHPERLINVNASKPIIDEFIKEVKKYKEIKNK